MTSSGDHIAMRDIFLIWCKTEHFFNNTNLVCRHTNDSNVNEIRRQRSESPTCKVKVKLQTELDDSKSDLVEN